jgi:hypothetical protein
MDPSAMQHKPLTKAYMRRKNLLDREPARKRMVRREGGIGALTNQPKKVVAPQGNGIRVADQAPLRSDQPRYTHQLD